MFDHSTCFQESSWFGILLAFQTGHPNHQTIGVILNLFQELLELGLFWGESSQASHHFTSYSNTQSPVIVQSIIASQRQKCLTLHTKVLGESKELQRGCAYNTAYSSSSETNKLGDSGASQYIFTLKIKGFWTPQNGGLWWSICCLIGMMFKVAAIHFQGRSFPTYTFLEKHANPEKRSKTALPRSITGKLTSDSKIQVVETCLWISAIPRPHMR